MTGEGGTVDRPDPAQAAASLRALLVAIDAAEVAASEAQRAYLAGAADTLEELAALEVRHVE